jgi:hypothetical protein
MISVKALLDELPYYKSNLMDDLRELDEWHPNPEKKDGATSYTVKNHTFYIRGSEIIYFKENVGDLSFRISCYKNIWLQQLLVQYHEEIIHINPEKENWMEMFSGMDISKRIFIYSIIGDIEFGDLTSDILNGRSPRYARAHVRYGNNYNKYLLDGILYVEYNLYSFDAVLFPNVEKLYNKRFKKLEDKDGNVLEYQSAVDYLLSLPQRGLTKKALP